jgi:arginyl-tRNA synthetase
LLNFDLEFGEYAILYIVFKEKNSKGKKMLLKEEMKRALTKALKEAEISYSEDQLIVEHPPRMEMGDLASTLPLVLARVLKSSPKAIAEKLLPFISSEYLSEISVAPNGYINAFVSSSFLIENLKKLILNPYQALSTDSGQGKKALIEFVSANPTGPLTVANARGGPIGATISNMIKWNGYQVSNEYYVNDKGAKIEKLARSVWYYYQTGKKWIAEVPEEMYPGEYVQLLAKKLIESRMELSQKALEAEVLEKIKAFCLESMLVQAKEDLSSMNVHFDSWFYEHTLHPTYLNKTLERLKEKDCTYEAEGALWLKTTSFGDDKDRVLVRSTGIPTYLAGDITYHVHKYDRGFDLIVDVWGADQSHQKPLKWALEALGYDTSKWKTVVFQLVHLFRGQEEVKMSKSSGDYITLRDLMEEVGCDVTRFLFLTRSNEQHLNFDMDLAKTRDLKNPVFYAQYAYTRCKGILREAEKKGFCTTDNCIDLIDPASFKHETEWMILRKLAILHDQLHRASLDFSPHIIAQSILALSADFHQFYENCRILGIDDPKIAQNRLAIVVALEKVLDTLFNILGISSPERM